MQMYRVFHYMERLNWLNIEESV